MSAPTRKVIREALNKKGKWTPRDMAYGDRTQALWKNQKGDQKVADPVEIVEGLQEMSDNDAIINYLANQAGGYFVRTVELDDRSKCLHSRVAKLFEKLTKVVVTVTDVVSDNRIDDHEIEMLVEVLNEYTEVQKQIVESAKKGYWQ
jgi:hypothetical protein